MVFGGGEGRGRLISWTRKGKGQHKGKTSPTLRPMVELENKIEDKIEVES